MPYTLGSNSISRLHISRTTHSGYIGLLYTHNVHFNCLFHPGILCAWGSSTSAHDQMHTTVGADDVTDLVDFESKSRIFEGLLHLASTKPTEVTSLPEG